MTNLRIKVNSNHIFATGLLVGQNRRRGIWRAMAGMAPIPAIANVISLTNHFVIHAAAGAFRYLPDDAKRPAAAY
jgi:hypothetical protein